MKTHTSITLYGLELSVHLGWPRAEQIEEQIVSVDIIIDFPEPPKACQTDQLSDTVCYAGLVSMLKENILPRKFRLVEHLGHEIYDLIKHAIPTATITIRVTKKPVISNLTGGVVFSYGDV